MEVKLVVSIGSLVGLCCWVLKQLMTLNLCIEAVVVVRDELP